MYNEFTLSGNSILNEGVDSTAMINDNDTSLDVLGISQVEEVGISLENWHQDINNNQFNNAQEFELLDESIFPNHDNNNINNRSVIQQNQNFNRVDFQTEWNDITNRGDTLTGFSDTLLVTGEDNMFGKDITFVTPAVPAKPVFDLAPESDTGNKGDKITEHSKVDIVGKTDADATVGLIIEGKLVDITTANSKGEFKFKDVSLTEGKNTLTVSALNPGNQKSNDSTQTITREDSRQIESCWDDCEDNCDCNELSSSGRNIPNIPPLTLVPDFVEVEQDVNDPIELGDGEIVL